MSREHRLNVGSILRAEGRPMDWQRHFKFEAKFGWAEAIALGALVVAAYAALTSGKTKGIVVAQEVAHNIDFFYEDQPSGPPRFQRLFYDRVSITNTGEQEISVAGISAIQGSYWKKHFMVGVKNDHPGAIALWPRSLVTDQEVTQLTPKVFFLPEDYDQFLRTPSLMLSKANFSEDELRRLNFLLKPSEKRTINIGAVLDPKGLPDINALHFGYQVNLSDGSSYELARSYPVYPVDIRK
jgi:hypothetical protein